MGGWSGFAGLIRQITSVFFVNSDFSLASFARNWYNTKHGALAGPPNRNPSTHASGHGATGFGLRASGFGLRASGFGLRASGFFRAGVKPWQLYKFVKFLASVRLTAGRLSFNKHIASRFFGKTPLGNPLACFRRAGWQGLFLYSHGQREDEGK